MIYRIYFLRVTACHCYTRTNLLKFGIKCSEMVTVWSGVSKNVPSGHPWMDTPQFKSSPTIIGSIKAKNESSPETASRLPTASHVCTLDPGRRIIVLPQLTSFYIRRKSLICSSPLFQDVIPALCQCIKFSSE